MSYEQFRKEKKTLIDKWWQSRLKEREKAIQLGLPVAPIKTKDDYSRFIYKAQKSFV